MFNVINPYVAGASGQVVVRRSRELNAMARITGSSKGIPNRVVIDAQGWTTRTCGRMGSRHHHWQGPQGGIGYA